MSAKKSRKNRKRNPNQGSIKPARTENESDDRFSAEPIAINDNPSIEPIDGFLNKEDQLNEKLPISASPREERIVNDAVRDLRRTALTGGITILGLVSFIVVFS
jgi:hypothetical protein